tara:strand:- start:258 stop:455 length:198 start_codon:yes stop_codon:yes gene_type:complete
MEHQEEKKTLMRRIKKFIGESRRVFKITKKPDKVEFLMIVKVTGIGILIIGAMGFIIRMLWEMLS